LEAFLEKTLSDAICYARHAKRKTLSADDIHFALRRQGRILYM
jgi:histone H4